jgi:uncharacterized RmlC-like cupin family protein
MSEAVRRIAPEERTEGSPTSGMTREEAIATDGMWAGFVRTEPGMVSDWHHHGDYESAIYVLSGSIRMEFGPDGTETADAGPGDFVFVPKNAVHRESSTSQDESRFIVVRAGSGQVVFNVEGPEA